MFASAQDVVCRPDLKSIVNSNGHPPTITAHVKIPKPKLGRGAHLLAGLAGPDLDEAVSRCEHPSSVAAHKQGRDVAGIETCNRLAGRKIPDLSFALPSPGYDMLSLVIKNDLRDVSPRIGQFTSDLPGLSIPEGDLFCQRCDQDVSQSREGKAVGR